MPARSSRLPTRPRPLGPRRRPTALAVRLGGLLAVACGCLLSAAPAWAVPATIAMQGRLATPGGAPVADGGYGLLLKVYDGPGPAANVLYTEAHIGVPVAAGLFSLQLGGAGTGLPLPPDLFAKNGDTWLGISVDGDPELPRAYLGAVPYAHRAGSAKTADSALVASSLACTGCISADMLSEDVLKASSHVALYAGAPASTQYALSDLDSRLGAFEGALTPVGDKVGVGVDPPQCKLDVSEVCYQGMAAHLVVNVPDEPAMQALQPIGATVYRLDEDKLFTRTPDGWRAIRFEPFCGDGFVEGLEVCDDGKANALAPDACRPDCTLPTCGDAVTDSDEACDDGNGDNTDACVQGCVAASCGDGYVQTGVEACDDGNGDNTDACVQGCVVATCGDGFVQAGVETCDDGNNVDGDGCDNACQLETQCPPPSVEEAGYCWVQATSHQQNHASACSMIGKAQSAKQVNVGWNNALLTKIAANWGYTSIGDYNNSAHAMWCNNGTKQCGTHNFGDPYDNYGPYGDSSWWPVYTCIP